MSHISTGINSWKRVKLFWKDDSVECEALHTVSHLQSSFYVQMLCNTQWPDVHKTSCVRESRLGATTVNDCIGQCISLWCLMAVTSDTWTAWQIQGLSSLDELLVSSGDRWQRCFLTLSGSTWHNSSKWWITILLWRNNTAVKNINAAWPLLLTPLKSLWCAALWHQSADDTRDDDREKREGGKVLPAFKVVLTGTFIL